MRYLLLCMFCWAGCNSTACTQEFHSTCRLLLETANGHNQFSGVAISDKHILTTAHGLTTVGDIVWVEFPVRSHGSSIRIKLRAVAIKMDAAADLCLLQYDAPQWLRITPCKLARVEKTPARVRIRGYVRDVAMQVDADVLRYGDFFDGTDVPLDLINAKAIQGMSGSPVTVDDELVGIQEGGDDTALHVITLPAIQKFLP
jgi:hypothetical protein